MKVDKNLKKDKSQSSKVFDYQHNVLMYQDKWFNLKFMFEINITTANGADDSELGKITKLLTN
jgi:hypothetical protein